jgi:hypothetical protein
MPAELPISAWRNPRLDAAYGGGQAGVDGNRTNLGRLISAPQTVLKNPGGRSYSKPAQKGRNHDGFFRSRRIGRATAD